MQSIITDANKKYLQITLNPKQGQILAVSGWSVGLDNARIPIPKATALPRQGQINEESLVLISNPSTLIISPKRSPLGVSFRENKCIGMLGHFQDFVPPLPEKCLACIETIGPSTALGVNYPDYHTCVDTHKAESDFFANTWRIYLASSTEWTTEHKVVRLYDEQGKLLDTYSF